MTSRPKELYSRLKGKGQALLERSGSRNPAGHQEIVSSLKQVFDLMEKALDGMPIPGPKAAFGAASLVLKQVQVRPSRSSDDCPP